MLDWQFMHQKDGGMDKFDIEVSRSWSLVNLRKKFEVCTIWCVDN